MDASEAIPAPRTSPSRAQRTTGPALPGRLIAITTGVALLWWGLSALRHALLQSNAFDLGIYDQVAWLISRGLEPRSSLLDLHHMGNHGAWAFYPFGLLYRLHASVQWLFMLQAGCLAFTAIPLWRLARWRGLNSRLCWLICTAWWLQPVVFNTNLYDFHPETLAMPLLAASFLLQARGRWLAWMLVLALVMGFRDGLCLIVIGLGLGEALGRRWRWALSAVALGGGWLVLLGKVAYPLLNDGQGPAALQRFRAFGDSLDAILWTLISRPQTILQVVNPQEVLTYLLLLTLPLAWSWRRRSLPALVACLPLVAVNAVSESSAQRNLDFHYNLPIAVLLSVAAIEGLAADEGLRRTVNKHLWLPLLWLAIWWVVLVDVGGESRDLVRRRPIRPGALELIADIRPDDRLLVPTYLAPHLSHRRVIRRPLGTFRPDVLDGLDLFVLNREDPGWSTVDDWNGRAMAGLRDRRWRCRTYPGGFLACRP